MSPEGRHEGKRIGIDLGTTNSVVAVVGGGIDRPDIVYSKEARDVFRSAVSLRRRRKGGVEHRELLIGDTAYDNWDVAPRDTIISVKRLMGRTADDEEVERVREWFQYEVKEPADGNRDSVRVVIGDQEYSPIDVSAMILRKMKEDAEYRLGEPVTHAVITVPAYFSQAQKAATRMAGVKAGLKVLKVLDEPTAAAIAYGFSESNDSEPKTILVYDLGGGTFDISVLMVTGAAVMCLDREGDMWLGGDNFDQAIVEFALARIREEYDVDPSGDPAFMVALQKEAQKAKERLGASESAEIIIYGKLRDNDGFPIDIFVEITRAEFDQLTRPLVARSMALVEKAISEAKVTDEEISAVLVAGNATKMPAVQEALELRFGKERMLRKKHPKHCVAEGAAILARLLVGTTCPFCGWENEEDATACANPECGKPLQSDGIRCFTCEFTNEPGTEVCLQCGNPLKEVVGFGAASRHYGIQLADDSFAVFVHKNDMLPTREPEWKTYYTQLDNQPWVSFAVWGGDNLEKANEPPNEKQGQLRAALPPGLPKGTEYRVSLSLNADEIFAVEAFLANGTPLVVMVEKDDPEQSAVLRQLEKCDGQLAELRREGLLDPDLARRAARLREEALGALGARDVDRAGGKASELEKELGTVVVTPAAATPQDWRAKGKHLIGFTEFLQMEYGWGFPAEQVYQLNQLMAQVARAIEENDEVAGPELVEKLDRATDGDKLPKLVMAAHVGRLMIENDIRPVEPLTAAELSEKLERAKETARANPQLGEMQILMVVAEIASRRPAPPPPPPSTPCPRCGAPYVPGQEICQGVYNGGPCNYNWLAPVSDPQQLGGAMKQSTDSSSISQTF